MWEPGTSAAHGVGAGWKIRNPKSEIRNPKISPGGWVVIPNSEFRIQEGGLGGNSELRIPNSEFELLWMR